MQVPPNLCTCQCPPLVNPSTAVLGASASTLRTTQEGFLDFLPPRGALMLLRIGAWASTEGIVDDDALALIIGRLLRAWLLLMMMELLIAAFDDPSRLEQAGCWERSCCCILFRADTRRCTSLWLLPSQFQTVMVPATLLPPLAAEKCSSPNLGQTPAASCHAHAGITHCAGAWTDCATTLHTACSKNSSLCHLHASVTD